MRLPEIAYRFSIPPGQAGPTFELCPRLLNVSGTAAVITANVDGIPKDQVLCLTNLQATFIPGATEAIDRGGFFGTSPSGVVFNIHNEMFAGTADAREEMNWSGEIYIGGGGRDATIVSCVATFDAAVAVGSNIFSIFGVVIPRGNIAPF